MLRGGRRTGCLPASGGPKALCLLGSKLGGSAEQLLPLIALPGCAIVNSVELRGSSIVGNALGYQPGDGGSNLSLPLHFLVLFNLQPGQYCSPETNHFTPFLYFP